MSQTSWAHRAHENPGTGRSVGHIPWARDPSSAIEKQKTPAFTGDFCTSMTYVAVTQRHYESPALTVELRSRGRYGQVWQGLFTSYGCRARRGMWTFSVIPGGCR